MKGSGRGPNDGSRGKTGQTYLTIGSQLQKRGREPGRTKRVSLSFGIARSVDRGRREINKPEQEGGNAPSLVIDLVTVAWRVDNVKLELDAVLRNH